jgi:hypothetical protein
MHVYHDDLGCPEGTILYDGCDECETRSKQGIGGLLLLDQDRVETLWRRMIMTERRDAEVAATSAAYPVRRGYLTDAEGRIGKSLYHLAILLERAGDPRAFKPGLFLDNNKEEA